MPRPRQPAKPLQPGQPCKPSEVIDAWLSAKQWSLEKLIKELATAAQKHPPALSEAEIAKLLSLLLNCQPIPDEYAVPLVILFGTCLGPKAETDLRLALALDVIYHSGYGFNPGGLPPLKPGP